MKKYVTILVLILISFLSSCEADDDARIDCPASPAVVSYLKIHVFYENSELNDPCRFGAELNVYGLNNINPSDVVVNFYKVEFKNNDVVWIPSYKFELFSYSLDQGNSMFILKGPKLGEYTHHSLTDIYRISAQCHIQPNNYFTETIVRYF